MIDLLTHTYCSLNDSLFESGLPKVSFRPTLTRKDVFQFSPPNQFEIGSGFITARPIEIIDDILHNMVHVCNHLREAQDVTQNQYHNLEFREHALKVGLVVSNHKTRGWGITFSDPDSVNGEKFMHPEENDFNKRREAYEKLEIPVDKLASFQLELQNKLDKKPSKQFQFKYVCECDPPCIARVGRRPDGEKSFNATCEYCGAKFALDKSRPDR